MFSVCHHEMCRGESDRGCFGVDVVSMDGRQEDGWWLVGWLAARLAR